MAFVVQDLRGQVLWGPTEGVGLLPTLQCFGKAKVHLQSKEGMGEDSPSPPGL